VCHAAYADNTYYENFTFNVLQNSNGLYGIQNAVSAASPLATGVIALMLEAAPTLTPNEIKTALQLAAVGDNETGAVPNNTWGHGKLNALLAIENALGISERSLQSSVIFPNPVREALYIASRSKVIHIDIRDTGGRLISRATSLNGIRSQDVSNLKSGLYLVTLSSEDALSKTFKIVKE
jgi:hypothetical protein